LSLETYNKLSESKPTPEQSKYKTNQKIPENRRNKKTLCVALGHSLVVHLITPLHSSRCLKHPPLVLTEALSFFGDPHLGTTLLKSSLSSHISLRRWVTYHSSPREKHIPSLHSF
jgi:hypothetical protein